MGLQSHRNRLKMQLKMPMGVFSLAFCFWAGSMSVMEEIESKYHRRE